MSAPVQELYNLPPQSGAPLQVDPAVSAIVHYVRSLYFKYKKSFADFYKSSLLYLAFISSDDLPQEQKLVSAMLAWARNVAKHPA